MDAVLPVDNNNNLYRELPEERGSGDNRGVAWGRVPAFGWEMAVDMVLDSGVVSC